MKNIIKTKAKLLLAAPLLLILFITGCNCNTPEGTIYVSQLTSRTGWPETDNGHYRVTGSGYPSSAKEVTVNFIGLPSNGGVTPMSGSYKATVSAGKFTWDFIIKSYNKYSQGKAYPDVIITGLNGASQCPAPSTTLNATKWDGAL